MQNTEPPLGIESMTLRSRPKEEILLFVLKVSFFHKISHFQIELDSS